MNKLKINIISAALFFTSFLLNYPLLPAQKSIKFEQISLSKGLKNSRVVSILQDSIGYMWFATHNGIEKFNGSEIQHFDLAFDTTLYAQDNIVKCIENSAEYDILCGSENGNIYQYHRKKNKFEPLILDEKYNALYNILSLHSEKNKIWIGTSGSFFYYDLNASRLVRAESIEYGVTDIININDTYLWLATQNGLKLLNKKSLQPEPVNHISKETISLDSADIMTIHKLGNKLVVCTREAEVYIIEYQNKQIKLLNYEQFIFNNKTYPIRDFIDTPEGDYAIAIDGIGLIITDKILNIKSIFGANDDDLNSISSNGIYKLFYSRDGILWLATHGGGVNFYDPNKKPFKITRHIPYIKNSLRNNIVNSIIEDDDKNIWYGTKKGISIHYHKSNNWKQIPEINQTETDPLHVMHMSKDKDGNIWVATYGNGLVKINQKTFEKEYFTKSKTNYNKIQTDHLYHVLVDKKQRIWTGGIWGNISVINPKTKTNHSINISNIRSLYAEKDEILVGTLFGLFIVNASTLEVSRTTIHILNESRIINISKHPQKNIIYFGTDLNGIICWNRDTQSIKTITTNDGLSANYIRSIEWDNKDKLWVATTGGLTSFNNNDSVLLNYLPIDGLANIEFCENASYKSKTGKLYFGGIDGITSFYPGQITISTQKTIPILTEIKLAGKKLNITTEGPLTENINTQKNINFKHNQNSINIGFSAIGFSTPEKIKYRWILDGFETQWNTSEGIKEAIYPKVPPGEYTFKVVSTNDDNIWQNNIKSLDITIAKPWWKTPVAYLVYMITLSGIIFLIIHYSRVIMQERHYEEKQQFFISIAHDLRTPLSLIKLPIEKMRDNSDKNIPELKNLNLVKRNIDRLTNMVNQLLDFQKSDLHKMQLQVEEQNIIPFLQNQIQSFIPLALEKSIALNLDTDVNTIMIWFDKGKFEKIMYNLLSNAIKYTPKQGNVEVTIKTDKKFCHISVTDNGEGIPKNQQKNIFERYYRATNAINSREVGSGVGLVLTKQLVELHHGQIGFKSELEKGTTFYFKIPMGKNHFNEHDFKIQFEEGLSVKPITQLETKEEEIILDKDNVPKLLIVEDNPELLESLAHELSSEYLVSKAENGEIGLGKAKSDMPDLIITDVMMPVMNGHQLCLKIKGDLSICHIPIIMLTALDSVDYKREGLEHGADAYVEKPFDLKILKAQIKNLIKNRQMLKQKFLIPTSGVAEISPTNQDQELLEKIQSHVLKNLDSEELSVENTAKELGMSRPVLYRKIKALTDLSPQQFVMNIKLKEAARIIKEDNKNISETAYMVGFSDPKYFSQTFKKHFGMTPSQYLKE